MTDKSYICYVNLVYRVFCSGRLHAYKQQQITHDINDSNFKRNWPNRQRTTKNDLDTKFNDAPALISNTYFHSFDDDFVIKWLAAVIVVEKQLSNTINIAELCK